MGDIPEISSVQFNGVDVAYDAGQGYFEFDVPATLAGGSTYDLTANFIDSSGNEKVYSTSVELTRTATAEFAVIPTVSSGGGEHFAVFDIYLNTELSKFAVEASAIDLIIKPTTQFEYISASRGPGWRTCSSSLTMRTPRVFISSAIALDTFNAGAGVKDEPLMSPTMKYKSASYDKAAVNDTLDLNLILVDEQRTDDFSYTLDFTDLIVTSTDV